MGFFGNLMGKINPFKSKASKTAIGRKNLPISSGDDWSSPNMGKEPIKDLPYSPNYATPSYSPNYMPVQQQPSFAEDFSSKDIQLLISKIDLVNAKLDNLNQRLNNIEQWMSSQNQNRYYRY